MDLARLPGLLLQQAGLPQAMEGLAELCRDPRGNHAQCPPRLWKETVLPQVLAVATQAGPDWPWNLCRPVLQAVWLLSAGAADAQARASLVPEGAACAA